MKNELGTRMKENYENSYRIKLTRRTPVIIRLDGKAFHTLTRKCDKPFDEFLYDAMFETMKTATLLQKLAYSNPSVLPVYDVLEMATINGAEALGLENSIGSLEPGKKADVILIDLSKPHLKPLHNVMANIVHSAHGSDVNTVIVDGKILMEDRCLKTLDEKMIMEKATSAASNLLSR